MGNFLLGLLISIVSGIIIIISIFMLTKKKTVDDKSQKQKSSTTSDTSAKTTKDESSRKVNNTKSNSFASIIGYIIGFALAAVVVIWSLCFVCKVWKNTFPSKPKEEVVSLPSSYTKSYNLKKGERPIRVYIPLGYSCTYDGAGKEYYFQPDNLKKPIILGKGKTFDGGEHVSFFDLSYYNEEVIVLCTFKRIK